MLHGEPEYRRRARQKAAKNQEAANREWDKAAQERRHKEIITTIKGIEEKLARAEDEATPKNKRERRWHKAEVSGLWAAAVVGVAAIVIGNLDAGSQRGVMQAQIDEMKAEQRPWVSADIGIGDITWSDGAATFSVSTTMKNIGHSPAFFINVTSEAHPALDFNALLAAQRKLSELERKRTPVIGPVIFPGTHDITQPIIISVTHDEVADFQRLVGKNGPVLFVPIAVLVVIDYVFSGDTVHHHQTGYMLNVYYRAPDRPGVPGMSLPIGKDVAAKDLVVSYHILGQYAD